jgi:hypothetical protein
MNEFSKFTDHPLFGEINEAIWPVFGNRNDALISLGTSVSIGPRFALTAWHYIDELTGRICEASQNLYMSDERITVAIYNKQNDACWWWNVSRVLKSSVHDIALLSLAEPKEYPEEFVQHAFVPDFKIPKVGTEIFVVGYRRPRVEKCVINGKAAQRCDPRTTTSKGRILDVYPKGRDKCMMPWPCFRTDAAFDDGMSGGPVFDATTGKVIGLVCSSMDSAIPDDPLPDTSYASLLYPILAMEIKSGDIGIESEKSVMLHELYKNGQVTGIGWDDFTIIKNEKGTSYNWKISL